MLTIDWASNIWRNELAEASDISVASLCAYYRLNIGDLNNMLGTCFQLNNVQGTQNYLEITDNNGCLLNNSAAAIYKYLYLLNYYARQIRANLGIGGISQTLSVQSDGGVVRLIDKTQIAKVYLQLREDTQKTLSSLVNKYKIHNQNALSVDGDDVFVNPNSYPYYEDAGVLYQQDIL